MWIGRFNKESPYGNYFISDHKYEMIDWEVYHSQDSNDFDIVKDFYADAGMIIIKESAWESIFGDIKYHLEPGEIKEI